MSSFIKEILLPVTNILVSNTKCDKKIIIKSVVLAVETYLKSDYIETNIKESKESNIDHIEEKQKKKSVKKSEKVEKKKKAEQIEENTGKVCEYIFVRSPKKGQKCSSRIDKKSEHYCSKHIKKPEEKDDTKAEKKVNKKPADKIKTEKTKAMNQLSESLKNFIDNKKTTQIRIERNKHGNYECVDEKLCGLLVDPVTLEVFGTQDESGRINELTRDSIALCKEVNLLYKLPLSLSQIDDEKNKNIDKEYDNDDVIEDQDCDFYEDDGMSDMSDIEG
jgi:hypothetical protein